MTNQSARIDFVVEKKTELLNEKKIKTTQVGCAEVLKIIINRKLLVKNKCFFFSFDVSEDVLKDF